jgi:hypothetical protein
MIFASPVGKDHWNSLACHNSMFDVSSVRRIYVNELPAVDFHAGLPS